MWRNPLKELKPHFYSDFVLLYIIFFLVSRNLILDQLHVCKHELFCHKNCAEAEPSSERSYLKGDLGLKRLLGLA